VPDSETVTFALEGFRRVEVNPPGPSHKYVALMPASVTLRSKVDPTHRRGLLDAVTIIGATTETVVVALAEQPLASVTITI
jgi:hypothetical protein